MVDFEETSGLILKNDLESANVNWEKLQSSVEELLPLFRYAKTNYDVEEDPPAILKEGFIPHSWVGSYPGTNLQIVPSKITPQEYSEMKRDIISWIQTLGSPFFEMLIRCFPSELLERKAAYAFFSSKLIDYTEILLTHQLHRQAIIRNIVDREPRGKIQWNRIIPIRYKDPFLLALRQTRFTFNTLPNLLLTQFHARIGKCLQAITDLTKRYEKQRVYHHEFVSFGLPADLLNESLEMDFASPELLEKVRESSPPLMLDILDLWENFLSRRAHLLDVSERFDAAIKPMSKVYELWCLKVLCDVLKELTGTVPKSPVEFPCTFNFSKLQLHYNKSESTSSGILRKLNVRPGRADFLFSFKEGAGIVADAKYREIHNIRKEDYQRFLSYLLDYLYPWRDRLKGIIFHVSEGQRKTVNCKGVQLHLLPLRPSHNIENAKKEIKDLVEDLV